MAAPSPAEINRANFRFWKQRKQRLDYLLERRYFQSEFGRVMASNGKPDCSDSGEMLSGQFSFYAFADQIAEASGKFAAQQRRRQAPAKLASTFSQITSRRRAVFRNDPVRRSSTQGGNVP